MHEDPQHDDANPEANAEAETDGPTVTPIDSPAEGDIGAAVDVAFLEAELAKAKEDMLRALAEAENTRRRGERAAQDARVYAIDKFARDLLPVVDTLGRALMSVGDREGLDETTKTLISGVEMTEKSLLDAFERHGLKRIGTKGEAFDPNLHQVVAQAPIPGVPAGAVGEVMQAGYILGDRTLRAAMVVVSAGSPAEAPSGDGGGSDHVDIKV